MAAADFSVQLKGFLEEYTEEVRAAAAEVIPEVGKEAVKKLKADSPKRSGKYAKGWRYKSDDSRTGVGGVVYGVSGTYQLAHLLEFGHATRGGGRSAGAHPHIAPVEEWATDEVYNRVIDRL